MVILLLGGDDLLRSSFDVDTGELVILEETLAVKWMIYKYTIEVCIA